MKQFGTGRHVPKGENRNPRTKPFTVYLSQEELELLDKRVKQLGYKSRSGLVTSILLPLMNQGFGLIAFVKLGYHFAKNVAKSDESKVSIEDLLTPVAIEEIEKSEDSDVK